MASKRDLHFVDCFVARLAESDGVLTDDVLAGAYTDSHGLCYGNPGTTPAARVFAVNAAKQKLKHADIREALRDVYQAAGFDILEAIEWHLKHIRGDVPTKKGHLPPNYAALRDLTKVILPQPATRIEKRVLHGHVVVTGDAPAIAARSIGDGIIEQTEDVS